MKMRTIVGLVWFSISSVHIGYMKDIEETSKSKDIPLKELGITPIKTIELTEKDNFKEYYTILTKDLTLVHIDFINLNLSNLLLMSKHYNDKTFILIKESETIKNCVELLTRMASDDYQNNKHIKRLASIIFQDLMIINQRMVLSKTYKEFINDASYQKYISIISDNDIKINKKGNLYTIATSDKLYNLLVEFEFLLNRMRHRKVNVEVETNFLQSLKGTESG